MTPDYRSCGKGTCHWNLNFYALVGIDQDIHINIEAREADFPDKDEKFKAFNYKWNNEDWSLTRENSSIQYQVQQFKTKKSFLWMKWYIISIRYHVNFYVENAYS